MIKIVFTASNTWIGRLIRWFTRSKVSHVMLEYTSELWGGQWIAEATATGVRKVPARRARHDVVAEFECLFDADKAIKEIGKYVGLPYDYVGLIVFAWAVISWRYLKTKIRKPLNNTKGQFCSEFITHFFKAAQLVKTQKWDPELSKPGRLFNYCLKHEELFREVEEPQ